MRDLRLLSGGEKSKIPDTDPEVCTVMVNLADFKDAHYDLRLRSHVGYHVDTQMGLLRSERYQHMLARAATLAWSCRTVRVVCLCKRGRHRSVATVALLEKLFHRIHPNLVRHLESQGWYESTCAGECSVCMANETPPRVTEVLNQVYSQMPCRKVSKDVWYLRAH